MINKAMSVTLALLFNITIPVKLHARVAHQVLPAVLFPMDSFQFVVVLLASL